MRAATNSGRLWFVLICAVLALTILAVYRQVQNHEFVNLDDNFYIYDNPHIQAGLTCQSVAWAFNPAKEIEQTGIWHPLTSLSHILDIELFGLDAGRHHFVNTAFHIVNTLLLLFVFRYMTGRLWPSVFVAVVFAFHPQHVESVAWASERKDVLSAMFWMLTMLAYAYYAKRPNLARYVLIFPVFALGLMSKPMLVTLPFVLLLLDYWPLQRFDFAAANIRSKLLSLCRLVVEKIPLFILSAGVCVITYFAQKGGGAVASMGDLPVKLRIFNVAAAYIEYIKKFFYPVNLSAIYPIQLDDLTLFRFVMCLTVLIALSVCIFYFKRHRYLAMGWLWFLGTFVPVIGFVQVGSLRMTDHSAYIPHIGLAIIAAWGLDGLCGSLKYRKTVLWTVFSVVLVGFAAMSWRQAATWRNSVTLFENAIKAVPNNWYAHKLMAYTLQNEKKYDLAIEHYKKVLEIRPSMDIQHNIGNVLMRQGKFDEAIELYQQILPEIPDSAQSQNIITPKYGKESDIVRIYVEGHINSGIAFEQKGNLEQAARHYKEALRIRPDYNFAKLGLARVLTGSGKFEQAMKYYEGLLQAGQISGEMFINLGTALLQANRIDDAVVCFENAIRIEPNGSMAYYHLGDIFASQGRIDEAIEMYRKVLEYYPEWIGLTDKLARFLVIYKESKYYNPIQAISLSQFVCGKVDYNVPEPLDTLAIAYASDGKFAQAIETGEKAAGLAESMGKSSLAQAIRERIELYKNGKAYSESLPKTSQDK